jgi:hypothetical protein
MHRMIECIRIIVTDLVCLLPSNGSNVCPALLARQELVAGYEGKREKGKSGRERSSRHTTSNKQNNKPNNQQMNCEEIEELFTIC